MLNRCSRANATASRATIGTASILFYNCRNAIQALLCTLSVYAQLIISDVLDLDDILNRFLIIGQPRTCTRCVATFMNVSCKENVYTQSVRRISVSFWYYAMMRHVKRLQERHAWIRRRLCFTKLKLLLLAIEIKGEAGGSDSKISINPRGAKIAANTQGFFIAQSADEVKR